MRPLEGDYCRLRTLNTYQARSCKRGDGFQRAEARTSPLDARIQEYEHSALMTEFVTKYSYRRTECP